MLSSKTVMFAGTCSARSELTLVSHRIMRPFQTKTFTIRFPTGTNNLMSLRFYYAGDPEAPASGRPSGISLLQDYGQVDYVRGEGIQITLDHVVADVHAGGYLKVYANNTDFYDHAVDVDIEIQVEDDGEI